MGGEGQQQEPEEPEAEDNNVPYRSPVQKRRSIYNWNPGPRRGKEDAFEKQIAGKWHVIAGSN